MQVMRPFQESFLFNLLSKVHNYCDKKDEKAIFQWNIKIIVFKRCTFQVSLQNTFIKCPLLKNNIGMNIEGTHLKLVGKLKAATSSIIYHGFQDLQKLSCSMN